VRVRSATPADAEAMARVHTESSDAAYADHLGGEPTEVARYRKPLR
jgi:hypothetical protein